MLAALAAGLAWYLWPLSYEAALDRFRQAGGHAAHFPASVPDDATDVAFRYTGRGPVVGMGHASLRLTFRTSPTEVDRLLSQERAEAELRLFQGAWSGQLWMRGLIGASECFDVDVAPWNIECLIWTDGAERDVGSERDRWGMSGDHVTGEMCFWAE